MIAAAMHKTIFSGDDMIFLPKDRVVIDQAVPQAGSVVLPSEIVDHFIRPGQLPLDHEHLYLP